MQMLSILSKNLAGALNPAYYLEEMGLTPFDWQYEALDPTIKNLLLLCARQTGKSVTASVLGLSTAKHYPYSLIPIISHSQDKSKELMKKIDIMMPLDPYLPELVHDAVFEKEFSNGSRIIALPGSEKSVRGYSGPKLIIVDEAARVLDDTYRAARPMMVGGDTKLIVLSTAFGKRGFFWEAWENGKHWKKILVRIPWDIKDGKHFVPAPPLSKLKAYWKERGVSAYYSTRHTLDFLKEEYDEGGGELWIRQEYLCEFLNVGGGIFSDEDWEDAIDDNIAPMFQDEDAVDDEIDVLFGGGG